MRLLPCIVLLLLTTNVCVWGLLVGNFGRSATLLQSPRSSLLTPHTSSVRKVLALRSDADGTINDGFLNNDKKTFCTCVGCKCAYWVTPEELGPTGATKVTCKLCKSGWFQSADTLMEVNNERFLIPLPEDRVEQARRSAQDGNFVKYWPKDKVSLFVGNLPPEYTEQDLGDLVAEYGIFKLQVVRDREGASRGFAFVDLYTQEDADEMVREMANFYVAPDRKLNVRPVTVQPPGPRLPPTASAVTSDSAPKAKKTWSRHKGVELVSQV